MFAVLGLKLNTPFKLYYKDITKAIQYTLKLVLQELMVLRLVGTLDPIACWEADGDVPYISYIFPYYMIPKNDIFTCSVSD